MSGKRRGNVEKPAAAGPDLTEGGLMEKREKGLPANYGGATP